MTLSAIDSKTINGFEKYYNSLPEKEKLLKQLIRKKNGLRQTYSDEYHDLCREITELEQEINDMKDRTQEIDYLMKAAPHFLEYSKASSFLEDNITTQEVFAGFYVKKNEGMSRGRICDEYIKECIGEGYSLSTRSKEEDLNKELTCETCGIEKLTNPRESYASCPNCGAVTRYQDTQNNKGEYSEEVEVLSPFAYKRINHFKEWLNTLTGEEGSAVNEEVIQLLRYEMLKMRIERREQVTEELIKEWLKKLKLPKLYEHAPAIRFKLCGIPPPKISRELKDKLIEMFHQIQNPFEKHAPADRKNFLSYSYTLHKMCQLLRQDHLLGRLSLLKSREKLYQQDLIWRGICKDMGWAFIKSL